MNTALLRSLQSLAPDGVELEIFDALDVPIYNGDVEEQGDPGGVIRLKRAVAEADGLILACPEYNGGLTPSLKNQIDWATRGEAPLKGKPCGVVGAGGGMYGTVRAQNILKPILVQLGCSVLPSPAVGLPKARDLFTNGELVDEAALERLEKFMAAFVRWTTATRDW